MSQNADRLNRLQIREQEQLNHQRREQLEVEERRQTEAQRRAKNQYSHIKSHGYGNAGQTPAGRGRGSGSGATGDDAEIRVFVRECDTDAARNYAYWESAGLAEANDTAGVSSPPRQPQPQKGSGVRSGDGGTRLPPVRNPPRQVGRGTAAVPSSSSSPVHAGPVADAPNKGRVPRYLQQRKAELAAEKEAVESETERRRELAKIPPGQRLVSEQEKAETLASLDARCVELEGQLGKIPIRFDTQAIRTRKANIEDELRQIETTKAKYSTKNPLYVPLY